MQDNGLYDVIVIGGSYAGLSAAMALGRSLKRVLILDGGKPCNRFTPHSQNFLTQDGVAPAEIAKIGKAQVLKYKTVSFIEDPAVTGGRSNDKFEIGTKAGKTYNAKKLIFATGLRDVLPVIPGFAECWGISAIHCPYCHGYEYHGRPTGILANGEMAYHYAQLVSNLTTELVVFTNGAASFTPEQTVKLKERKIKIIETQVEKLVHEKGYLEQVVLKSNTSIPVNAIYHRPVFEQHSDIPTQLGCELTEQGLIKVDMFQKTTAPGIYAAGDNCAMRAVAAAVATGNMAGAVCNKEITEEEF